MDAHPDISTHPQVGVVIIGRNEGPRLIACLKSAAGADRRLIYVDSGSTDGSVDAAKALGAEVVALDMEIPFTAARARNAGAAKLFETGAPSFIQFVDGDCTLEKGWIETAAKFLLDRPDVAAICGDLKEIHPEKTIYNKLCDREWLAPAGETLWCGGNAMIRADAFKKVGLYRPGLIAGEEPELCVRFRAAGFKIYRHESPMAQHDANMTSLSQWLKRARRTGHAYAEVSRLHQGKPEQIWAAESRRALLWAGIMVAAIAGGLFTHPLLFAGLALYPLQIARIALRNQPTTKTDWIYAALLMLQKPWEAAGVLQYWISRLRGRPQKIIEHKNA